MARTAGKVLIVSPHVMTAALVGWYVELTKLEPAFTAPGERPSDALARVKPLLVALIDAECTDAVNDLFAARAARRGIGLAMFSGACDDDASRHWATRHGIPFFRLPVDLEAFGRILDQAALLADADRRRSDRRQSSAAVGRAVDGTLRLIDEAGRAWYVYDRRGGERRLADGYRMFVSGEGVALCAPLSEDEFSAREASALVEQLARAQAAR